MALSVEQQQLVEQRLANEGKSVFLVYIILLFVGVLGIHSFYLGKTTSAIIMLLCTVLGLLTLPIVVGAVFLVAVGVWCVVDLFLVPGLVTENRTALRKRLSDELAASSDDPA